MEEIKHIQGSKRNYTPAEMQGSIFFSKDTKEILLNNESYGNATPADEEDLTAESGTLKLKDRSYDEANFQGKGYKILRKNVVDGKNILTQDMISDANTIYEIRYDFDLNGETITIPEGCTLKFEGGSFSNGTLLGNNTIVNSKPILCFRCALSGTFYSDDPRAEWLGNIQSTLDSFGGCALLGNKEYIIQSTIKVGYNQYLKGDISTVIISDGTFPIINLGYQSTVSGIVFKSAICSTVFSINSDFLIESYPKNLSSPSGLNLHGIAAIHIADCKVFGLEKSTKEVNCIECISNRGNLGSFWQVSVDNIQINGKYKYAIYISNESDTSQEGASWQTDQIYSNIKIYGAYNGIYIGSESGKTDSNTIVPERITFYNVSMQAISSYVQYFLVANGCNRVVLDSCEPWDFPEGAKKYKVARQTSEISIINNKNSYLGPSIDYYNVSDYLSNKEVVFSDFSQGNFSASYNLRETIQLPVDRCFTFGEISCIPPGIYFVDANEDGLAYKAIGWPLGSNQGGLLYVIKFDNGKLLKYIPFHRGISSTSAFSAMLPTSTCFIKYDGSREFTSEISSSDWAIESTTLLSLNNTQVGNTGKVVGNIVYNHSTGQINFTDGSNWFRGDGNPYNILSSGSTSQRPTNRRPGFAYYDTSIGKYIFWNGSQWIDPTENISWATIE